MRATFALALLGALVLVVDACGSLRTTTTVEKPLTAPPDMPLPGSFRGQAPLPPSSTTTTLEPLPNPVVIPTDGYTDEPVVDYGSIQIPKIGLVHELYEGVTLNNIDEGPSHWTGTATPGRPGNAVFAGHRVTHDHPFRRIDELVPGDEVIFVVKGERSVYKVTGSIVVGPDAVWIGNQTREATATLYACHPPGSATERYVVQLALASTGPAVS